MDMYHCIFAQIHKSYNTKNELSGKQWTLDGDDLSIYVILGKICTILVSDIDNEEGYTCVQARVYEKSLDFPLNFIELL